MTITKCSFCGYQYDEWLGDCKNGVPPGVPLRCLAGTVCSRCGLQGERHQVQAVALYRSQEAEYYDHFAGKAGIHFFLNWVAQSKEQTRVLEVGVGTGRIALPLSMSGVQVTGIDVSPDMLQIAEKRRHDLLKERADLLQLHESDIRHFQDAELYTHAILSEGLLQHFHSMEEQLHVLHTLHGQLARGGQIAVDLLIPPSEAHWEFVQGKTFSHKQIQSRTKGQTSLARQLFRYETVYETYVDQMEQSRFRVERELSLMTPRELFLLLETSGFEVEAMIENYGSSHTSWESCLGSGFSPSRPPLAVRSETLEELASMQELGDALPYRAHAWQEGGYPFHSGSPSQPGSTASRWTLLARKAELKRIV